MVDLLGLLLIHEAGSEVYPLAESCSADTDRKPTGAPTGALLGAQGYDSGMKHPSWGGLVSWGPWDRAGPRRADGRELTLPPKPEMHVAFCREVGQRAPAARLQWS